MIEVIEQIIEEKKLAKRFPTHCTLLEVIQASGKPLSELRPVLSQLRKDGVIHIGPTLNSFYITIK